MSREDIDPELNNALIFNNCEVTTPLPQLSNIAVPVTDDSQYAFESSSDLHTLEPALPSTSNDAVNIVPTLDATDMSDDHEDNTDVVIESASHSNEPVTEICHADTFFR